jgi:hypothetical protein
MLRDAQPKAGFEASGNDSYRLNVPDKGISICAELDSGLKRRWAVRNLTELEHRCAELGGGCGRVAGLIPDRNLVLVVGDSGLGKSPLAYQLGVSVAAGVPFLGREVKQGRVLYLDYENGQAEVRDLISRLTVHLGVQTGTLGDGLLLWNFNDGPEDSKEGAGLEMMRCCKPDLVVVDSLSGYRPEIEEKNSIATRVLQEFRGLIRDIGCAVVLIHHIRKPSSKREEQPQPLEEASLRQWFLQARGGRALVNGSDVRLGLDEPRLARVCGEDAREHRPALVLRGFGRVRGEIPTLYLARALDDDGDPLGYVQVIGVDLLPHEQQEKYERLPPQFRFKQAKLTYGKGDQATTDFLKKCEALGILERVARGEYRKVGVAE